MTWTTVQPNVENVLSEVTEVLLDIRQNQAQAAATTPQRAPEYQEDLNFN